MLKVPRSGGFTGAACQYTIPTSSTTTNVIDIITAGGDDGRAGDVPRRISRAAGSVRQPALADRLEDSSSHGFNEATSASSRARSLLPCHRRRRRPARLLVQGRCCRASCVSPAPSELVFPDYDGNGMFKQPGQSAGQPNVGLLFMRLDDAAPPARQRHGPLSTRRPAAQVLRRRPADRACSRPSTSFPTARATSTRWPSSSSRPTPRAQLHPAPTPIGRATTSSVTPCRAARRTRA